MLVIGLYQLIFCLNKEIIIIIISLINQQYNTVTLASTLLTTIATKICQLLLLFVSYRHLISIVQIVFFS